MKGSGNVKRTVIIADDNRYVNDAVRDVFIEHNFTVVQAFDGIQTIDSFTKTKPDIVFLDYRMPAKDGLDVLREIKSRDPEVPVVVITGEGSEDVAVQAMKAGADDYITKPFSVSTVIGLADKLIKEHDLRQENIRLKEEVDAYKDYLAAITETIGEAVITTDSTGKIRFMNTTAKELLRVEKGWKGRHVNDLVGGLKGDLFNDIQEAFADGKTRFEREYILRPDNDSSLYVLLTASLQRREEYVGDVFIVIRDLSDIEDMRRQIVNAEKMAALGKVVEGVAHEIRNSLTSLGGFSRRLERMLEPGSHQRLYVDLIIEDVRRLEAMIRDIENYVNYTKIHKPRFVTIDISKVINEALSRTFASRRFEGIESKVRLPDKEIIVRADPYYLVEAFWNIFVNACEAMPEGGVLEIGVRRNTSSVTVDVKDTGHGIPKGDVNDVFNPFYTTKASGAGLGLTKVYMIIEEHGGDITIDSDVGKGTRVRIHLPLKGE